MIFCSSSPSSSSKQLPPVLPPLSFVNDPLELPIHPSPRKLKKPRPLTSLPTPSLSRAFSIPDKATSPRSTRRSLKLQKSRSARSNSIYSPWPFYSTSTRRAASEACHHPLPISPHPPPFNPSHVRLCASVPSFSLVYLFLFPFRFSLHPFPLIPTFPPPLISLPGAHYSS